MAVRMQELTAETEAAFGSFDQPNFDKVTKRISAPQPKVAEKFAELGIEVSLETDLNNDTSTGVQRWLESHDRGRPIEDTKLLDKHLKKVRAEPRH